MNLCLKFESEAVSKQVLYSTVGAVEANLEMGIETNPGTIVPNFKNIDTIGTIYKPTSQTQTFNGTEFPVMEAIPGWHCNVLVVQGEDTSVLEPYIVTPTNRVRVWAGESTKNENENNGGDA
jgi:hypothetical protein